MRIWAVAPFLIAMAFGLAGCGGGGGGHVATLPPPPPAPPPPPPPPTFVLIPGAATSQQFAVEGASHLTSGDAPQLDTADQLQVRYDASSNLYEVQLPGSDTWSALSAISESEAQGGGVRVVTQYGGYQYSNVIQWFADSLPSGVEAVGMSTPADGVPVIGTATYTANAIGRTSESAGPALVVPEVAGTMTFNFDFAHGTLAGSALFDLDPEWHDYTLGPFTFRDTVYSTGSTSFSGRFDTDVAGLNSFGGLFTGPNAEELMGNFALPYRSPIDSQIYQAAGAFVGRRN